MGNVKYFALGAVAVFIFSACTKDVLANNANATKSAEKTAPGPPKDALVTLEKSAYAAWKSKDASSGTRFFRTILSVWVRPGSSIRCRRKSNTPALIAISGATVYLMSG
jgi:hypothetical protein